MFEHLFDTDAVTAPAARRPPEDPIDDWDLPARPRRAPILPAIPGVRTLTRATAQGTRVGAIPVPGGLAPLLPDGLRRGATVEVRGAAGMTSLMLALLGGASSQGLWCAAVGFPLLSGEAAADYGIDLARFALVPRPGPDWITVVGALLDSIDLVAVRLPGPPARLSDGDARRLAARARRRGSVLLPAPAADPWPTADVRLAVSIGEGHGWRGAEAGYGRLQRRRVQLHASGRGAAARRRSIALWMPDRVGALAADGAEDARGTVSPLLPASRRRPLHDAAGAR